MSARDHALARIARTLDSGDAPGAVRLCRKQLRKRPGDTGAMKLLVQALLQSAQPAEACVAAERLLRLAPGDADSALLLGHALRFSGREADARGHLEQAVASRPEDANAWHELALVLRVAGTLHEALDAFERASALAPANPTYRDNACLALIEAGRPHDAVARCRETLARGEPDGDLRAILGQALMLVGSHAEARSVLEQALQNAPNDLVVVSRLGSCMVALGEFSQGIHLLRQCAASRTADPAAYNNLVRALAQAGHAQEALATFRHGIDTTATTRDGLALVDLIHQLIIDDRLDAAESLLDETCVAFPGNCELELERVRLLLHRDQTAAAATLLDQLTVDAPDDEDVLALQVQVDCATGRYGNALATVEHRLRDPLRKRRLLAPLLYPLNYADDCPPETLFRLHRAWATTLEAAPASVARTRASLDRDPERRLRVGYVSADFRDHSVAFFFEPLLSGHDPERVENFCYSNTAFEDEVTRRLRTKADHWRKVETLDDTQFEALIRSDRIDILVDLAGHTLGNRLPLFARKPAPVQVTCNGHVNTTGLHSIDFRLTDAISNPPGLDDHLYTETLVRLPVCHFCYHGIEAAPRHVRSASSEGLTFGSFNKLAKLSDTTLVLWARVLNRVPGSRLLLKARQLADDTHCARLLERFARLGVDAQRLELIARLEDKQAHLQLYNRIDIGLDTTPFNGITTTCESLWMGVPVIALHGDRYVARVAASLLHFAGLPELVAGTPDAFVETAAALATDRERLASYHAGLRDRLSRSSLCDVHGYARQVEAAYRGMWRRYLGTQQGSGEPSDRAP